MFQWDIGAFDRPDLDCRCFIRALSRLQYWINLPNSIYAKTQLYWEFNGTRMEAVFCCTTTSSAVGAVIWCSWLLTPLCWEEVGSSAEADLIDFILHQTSARLMITALCVNNSEERGEPRPRFKVQLTQFSGVAAISGSGCIIRFIPSLSISFNLRGRWRHQKKSSGQKAGHNWIIPQSGNVGKSGKHFILTSIFIPAPVWRSYQRPHLFWTTALKCLQNCQKSNSAKTSLLEQSAPLASLWCHFIFPCESDTWRFGQNIRI